MQLLPLFVVVLAVAGVAYGGPTPQNNLRLPQGDANLRISRQSDTQVNSPLGQLLQDALNIPQAALAAVSRLLTNPSNIIGQSTNTNRY